jgi:tripartite ATP-independent transporter DctP family solute receptor
MMIRIASAALVAVSFSLPAAAKEFRSADVHPEDYPTVMAVKQMSESVKKRTNGKHSIRVYTGTQLGGEKDTIEQTKLGALDLVRINSAPMNNIVPETLVPSLPFIFRDVTHMRKVLDGPIGDEILKALEAHGFIGLAFYDAGARSFYNTKKPIRTPADMKGMKIRVQQSDLFVGMLQALGANATPMPYGEVYTALKTGLVDGAENNWPSYDTARHFEVAKYYTVNEHSMVPEILMFSKKVFDTLPADEQKIFRAAAKESVPYMRKLWDAKELESRRKVEAAGVQVVDKVDKKPFKDAMKPVYDKLVTDAKLKAMVKRVQDTK